MKVIVCLKCVGLTSLVDGGYDCQKLIRLPKVDTIAKSDAPNLGAVF